MSQFMSEELMHVWLPGIAAAVVCSLVLLSLRRFMMGRPDFFCFGITKNCRVGVREFAQHTLKLSIVVTSVFIAMQFVRHSHTFDRTVSGCFIVVVGIQLLLWGNRLIDFLTHRLNIRTGMSEGERLTNMRAISLLGKMLLASILFLLVLENLGVNITALVAGLGIGGIAVGLAAQNILGDIFASLAIVLDRPFDIGDFITSSGSTGTVEKIGLKTTKIRSQTGEQLICPNQNLLKDTIQNFKRMQERRCQFTFKVAYDTSDENLAYIPTSAQKAVENNKVARFERANLSGVTGSAISFETIYWIMSPDYNLFAQIQQNINLSLIKDFRQKGIHFAPG